MAWQPRKVSSTPATAKWPCIHRSARHLKHGIQGGAQLHHVEHAGNTADVASSNRPVQVHAQHIVRKGYTSPGCHGPAPAQAVGLRMGTRTHRCGHGGFRTRHRHMGQRCPGRRRFRPRCAEPSRFGKRFCPAQRWSAAPAGPGPLAVPSTPCGSCKASPSICSPPQMPSTAPAPGMLTMAASALESQPGQIDAVALEPGRMIQSSVDKPASLLGLRTHCKRMPGMFFSGWNSSRLLMRRIGHHRHRARHAPVPRRCGRQTPIFLQAATYRGATTWAA